MSAQTPEMLDALMIRARDEEDRDAYQSIIESCHHLIRAQVLRDTADPELAEEIAQEVFVRGWIHRQQYRPGSNPRAWLLAISRNQVQANRRKHSRDARHMRELIRRELLRRAEQWSTDDHDLARQQSSALQTCIKKLNAPQRDLLDLVHGQGLSTEDAAAIMEIQAPTCRQRLSRLQRSLRQCVEGVLE